MPNVNKVILIGNLTRDPEVSYTPKGTATCELGLAINRTFTQGDEKKEEVTFVDVTLWGRVAEIAGEYAKKGRPIYIEGRLQLDQWEDKQTGNKRSKLKVFGENLQLLGSRSESGESGGQSSTEGPKKLTPKPTQRPQSTEPYDDITF
jgi:single-strand DNA-binding protein